MASVEALTEFRDYLVKVLREAIKDGESPVVIQSLGEAVLKANGEIEKAVAAQNR